MKKKKKDRNLHGGVCRWNLIVAYVYRCVYEGVDKYSLNGRRATQLGKFVWHNGRRATQLGKFVWHNGRRATQLGNQIGTKRH